MLEMMPGSSVDKTNNNLNNLTLAFSNITQKNGLEKENMTDIIDPVENSLISSNLDKKLEATACDVTTNFNITTSEINVNINNNSTNLPVKPVKSKLIDRKQKKIENFLEKHNICEKDLLEKCKYVRRLTKDKTLPNRILSLKINRLNFKNNKMKWSSKMLAQKKKQILRKYHKNKNREKYKDITSHSSQSSIKSVPNFETDDEIRNKIKEQLELLRQNKKTAKTFDETEVETKLEETIPDLIEENNAITDSNLQEIGLSIVKVVGGYISDENTEQEANEDKSSNQHAKGTSITDILLKRDFSDNSLNLHIIKPTKTNDITKIKGWRTKHFTVFEKPQQETVEKAEYSMINTLENPIPSTSANNQESEENNILKQGESAEKNKKSAFVSDMLDTFLSNHSQLKISYEVPKLVAEEAITKPASEMPVGTSNYLTVVNTNKSYKRKYPHNKPKTLAEKRRMLERDRQNQLLHDMETNETIYVKRLEYCEKRNKNEIAKDIRDNLVAEDAPISRYCWNLATKESRQFAVVDGSKIRIAGSSGGRDLVVPNEVVRLSTKENMKPINKIQYRPGPLSRKHKLMNLSDSDENWQCRVLKMPKIKLIVYPELGKRLPSLAESYVQLYRGKQGFISDELAKFAASAVCSKNMDKSKFEFELPYRNGQNKILVRKRVLKHKLIPVSKLEFSHINVEDSIKEIMSQMLNCVENQELDRIVIKNDPDLERFSEQQDKSVDRPPSPIDPRVQAIIKRPNAKRSKTTLELRRLNVQVIEVDVKEEELESKICTNDFCKLGCICKSIKGSAMVPQHCGRESCMLECVCNYGTIQRNSHSITLPAGTDILSSSTVVRLQDIVKRKLAKEEREFTQTVIKANNQTIMVGAGARERHRRIPKVPKKYSNYIQKCRGLSYDKIISNGLLEDEEEIESNKLVENPKPKQIEPEKTPMEIKKIVPIWNKKEIKEIKKPDREKECCVKLNKLSLTNVIPWCMIHNLYKCHCGGKSTGESSKPTKTEEEKSKNENPTEYIPYASRSASRIVPETSTTATIDSSDKYCARTRLVSNFYRARNKSQRFKARLAKMKEEQDKETVETNFSARETQKYLGEIEIKDDSDEEVVNINKNVTLVKMEDILKPQRKEDNKPCQIVSAASFIDYERSFLGILTPSSEWLDKFHKMLNLNLNTVIRQIRLLEWATLVKRLKKGTLQMWFNNRKYNNIILTEDRKRPSRSHMNIKLFENTPLHNFRVPEIILSIFRNKLPGVAKKDTETYVILVYNGKFWEARGTIVLNDTSEMCQQKLGYKQTPFSILDPVLRFENSPEKPSTNQNIFIRSTPSMSIEVVNNSSPVPKLIMNEKRGLEITKIPLTVDDRAAQQNVNSNKRKVDRILAPLPNGFGKNRWFLLILKNDFNVLRISFTNFHIKYTHLITAIQTAHRNLKTVRIKSQDKIENSFGIFAVPDFTDRIFFGPYDKDADHGLETFRYVNGKLVNTKIYNKMTGTTEKNTTGIWYSHVSTIQNKLCLDLQVDDKISSSSDCSTEATSAENAVKPRIEFVDLTGNDSDNDNSEKSQNVDPLFNVLSADFSKKITNDITIEPIFDKTKTKRLEVKQVSDDSAKINILPDNLNKKRKFIETINLDDDEEMPKLEHFNTQKQLSKESSFRQMPALRPINSMQDFINKSMKKRNLIYVITNIPGVGYFEIFLTQGKYQKKCIQININGKASIFPTINMAITWLHHLFRSKIFFIPSNLKVKFSILESAEVPDMSKFNEYFLNGYHMICEKGIFDLLQMSTNEMDNLGFSDLESSSLLAHKCELLINKNINILGDYLVGTEQSVKLDKARILHMAPMRIKIMEQQENMLLKEKEQLRTYQQQLLIRINKISKKVSENLRSKTRENLISILQKPEETVKNCTLPAGNFCQIMDGKIVTKNAKTSPKPTEPYPVRMISARKVTERPFEMLVPIAGLQNPATVVGLSNKSLLLANRKKSSKFVDLTGD